MVIFERQICRLHHIHQNNCLSGEKLVEHVEQSNKISTTDFGVDVNYITLSIETKRNFAGYFLTSPIVQLNFTNSTAKRYHA